MAADSPFAANEAADAPEGDSLLPVAGVDEQGNEVAHGAIGDIDFDDGTKRWARTGCMSLTLPLQTTRKSMTRS